MGATGRDAHLHAHLLVRLVKLLVGAVGIVQHDSLRGQQHVVEQSVKRIAALSHLQLVGDD